MKRRPWIELLFLIAGPVIWLAHYLLIYAINAVACARLPLGDTWMGMPVSSWAIVAASALALGAMAVVGLRQRKQVQAGTLPEFHAWLTAALCLLSAVAVAWETLPVFLASVCG